MEYTKPAKKIEIIIDGWQSATRFIGTYPTEEVNAAAAKVPCEIWLQRN